MPPAYCTFAVSEPFAFNVKVQVLVLLPPLLHAPDQITSRPLVAPSVTAVPTAKPAERVVPTGTLNPDGVDETVSPPRPVAVKVSTALLPPQTFATPPPPHVWGAVHVPQPSVPPQPSVIVPQFLPCAAHVVGVQAAGFEMKSVSLAHRP